jgi:hypothetical protein
VSSFTITVAVGSNAYAAYDNAATDGTATAAGILMTDVDAAGADADGVILKRGPASVTAAELVFESGQDAAAQAAALEDLKTLGIIAR